MKVVSLCFNGYWKLWIGSSFKLKMIDMPQTVCRTSGSDVMSFHFLKQDLREPALNCFTISSENCFKRSNQIPLIYYPSLTSGLVTAVFSTLMILKILACFLWPGLRTSNVLPIFWSPLLGLGRGPRVWWLFCVFSLTWIFFCFSTRTLTCFPFQDFLQNSASVFSSNLVSRTVQFWAMIVQHIFFCCRTAFIFYS